MSDKKQPVLRLAEKLMAQEKRHETLKAGVASLGIKLGSLEASIQKIRDAPRGKASPITPEILQDLKAVRRVNGELSRQGGELKKCQDALAEQHEAIDQVYDRVNDLIDMFAAKKAEEEAKKAEETEEAKKAEEEAKKAKKAKKAEETEEAKKAEEKAKKVNNNNNSNKKAEKAEEKKMTDKQFQALLASNHQLAKALIGSNSQMAKEIQEANAMNKEAMASLGQMMAMAKEFMTPASTKTDAGTKKKKKGKKKTENTIDKALAAFLEASKPAASTHSLEDVIAKALASSKAATVEPTLSTEEEIAKAVKSQVAAMAAQLGLNPSTASNQASKAAAAQLGLGPDILSDFGKFNALPEAAKKAAMTSMGIPAEVQAAMASAYGKAADFESKIYTGKDLSGIEEGMYLPVTAEVFKGIEEANKVFPRFNKWRDWIAAAIGAGSVAAAQLLWGWAFGSGQGQGQAYEGGIKAM